MRSGTLTRNQAEVLRRVIASAPDGYCCYAGNEHRTLVSLRRRGLVEERRLPSGEPRWHHVGYDRATS
jgi:hypothetical protein